MFLDEFEKLLASITKKRFDFTVIIVGAGDFNVRSTTSHLLGDTTATAR